MFEVKIEDAGRDVREPGSHTCTWCEDHESGIHSETTSGGGEGGGQGKKNDEKT